MLPFIRSGQVIRVAPLPAAELRSGDVILYRLPGGPLIAHRLLQKQWVGGRLLLLTKGDASPASKMELVETGQILGRVVSLDFGQGRNLRIDAGWGRLLGIWLARISPAIRWVYPPLSRLKAVLAGCRGSARSEKAFSGLDPTPPEAPVMETAPMVSLGLPGDESQADLTAPGRTG